MQESHSPGETLLTGKFIVTAGDSTTVLPRTTLAVTTTSATTTSNHQAGKEEQIWAARLHINALEAELAQVRARIVEQEQAAERTLELLFQLNKTSALALHDRERDAEPIARPPPA